MNLGTVKALQRALADGSVQFNQRDPGIVRCYEMGWLHAEPLDADVSKLVCVFPTKLHQKYVEYKLCGNTPFPITQYSSP
jgi:hypothetical protein